MKFFEELKWRGLVKDIAGDDLEDKLGHDLYRELFPLILTDRGVEFEKVNSFA